MLKESLLEKLNVSTLPLRITENEIEYSSCQYNSLCSVARKTALIKE